MGTEEDARKLFVAGLPETMTDDGLRTLFTSTGSSIAELSLPRDRATGRPRGFAFVTLSSPDEAQRARQQLDGSLVEGRSISVRPFTPGPPRAGGPGQPGAGGPGGYGGPPGGGAGGYGPPGGGGGSYGDRGGFERRPAPPRDDSNRTLYVGNLPYDIEEADLRSIFTQQGAAGVERVHLPMDHATGRKRGFAFVAFASEDAAKAALDALATLAVRGRPCTVHIAHPRGERPPPRADRPFGGPPGAGGPGGHPGPGLRSSPPPAGGPGRGPSFGGGGGFGPPGGDRGGRPPPRRAGDDDGQARGAKGATRKTRLQEEKRRGGGNARRYFDELDDDE